jgi:LEA14-like dessication related protein
VSAIFFCAVLLFAACKSLPDAQVREPVVSLESVEIVNVDYLGVKILCKVRVENPNAHYIPSPEINWECFLNTASFNKGVVEHSRHHIGAHDASVVEIPVELDYLEIFDAIDSIKGTKQADYKIALAVNFDVAALKNKAWEFEGEGVIPVLQAPVFGATVMRVEKIHRNMVEWYVSVSVENPNAFELPQPSHTFVYQVNERTFIRRSLQNKQPLASSSVTPIIFGLLVYYNDILRAFPDLITAKEIPCKLDMAFDFLIPAFCDDIFRLQIPAVLPVNF